MRLHAIGLSAMHLTLLEKEWEKSGLCWMRCTMDSLPMTYRPKVSAKKASAIHGLLVSLPDEMTSTALKAVESNERHVAAVEATPRRDHHGRPGHGNGRGGPRLPINSCLAQWHLRLACDLPLTMTCMFVNTGGTPQTLAERTRPARCSSDAASASNRCTRSTTCW